MKDKSHYNPYYIIIVLGRHISQVNGKCTKFQNHRNRRLKYPSFEMIGTGKTSLIRKYIHGTFRDEYEVTVGVDFSSKTVTVD